MKAHLDRIAIRPEADRIAKGVPHEPTHDRARRILVAMDDAAKEGRGAVALDGRLIDAASIRQAQVMVDKANQIERSLASRQ